MPAAHSVSGDNAPPVNESGRLNRPADHLGFDPHRVFAGRGSVMFDPAGS